MTAELEMHELVSTDFHSSPYATYARLRTQAPVYWFERAGSWLVSRYDDVLAGFRDPRLSSARMDIFRERLDSDVEPSLRPLLLCLSSFLGLSDPPDHTRMRRAVGHALNQATVLRMRERISQRVDELLDHVSDSGTVDVIADIGYPLPATTISEVLGLPTSDTPRFRTWTDDIVGFISSETVDDIRAEKSAESLRALQDYLRPLLADRRKSPAADLMSVFVSAEAQGLMNGDEVMATCVTTLSGGEKTTTNLIGNGIRALLTHRREFERLKRDPSLIKSAIEECLRYESPVPRAWRFARDRLTISGVTIAANEPVLLLVASANRDPHQFSNPDCFDIGRDPNRHLGFGFGAHHCIGASLARLELEVLFERLLARFDDLQLVRERQGKWKEDLALAHRGLSSLWVEFRN
jgi:cytochrome P450